MYCHVFSVHSVYDFKAEIQGTRKSKLVLVISISISISIVDQVYDAGIEAKACARKSSTSTSCLPILKQHPRHKISSIEGILHAWENEIMATLAKRHSIRCFLFS